MLSVHVYNLMVCDEVCISVLVFLCVCVHAFMCALVSVLSLVHNILHMMRHDRKSLFFQCTLKRRDAG